jgi:hypothetical protein
LKNIILASEDMKVRYIRLVTGKELIGCLLQELVEVEMMCGMICRIDRLCPKLVRCLVLLKHGSNHLYESLVLPFNHSNCLRGIGGRKLMLDAFFIKEVLYLSVFEHSAIVTSNLLDLDIELVLCPLQELL